MINEEMESESGDGFTLLSMMLAGDSLIGGGFWQAMAGGYPASWGPVKPTRL
jgi:hypothetical protein